MQSYSMYRMVFYSVYFCLISSFTVRPALSDAASLKLNWTDNSTNENGFSIERKIGTTGTFAQIATVGGNTVSYTDLTVVDGTTYCYRIRAYNSTANSAYSAEACGTTPSVQITFNLTVSKTGTGSGTVTTSPSGINCGSSCIASFQSGQLVTLTATPATGSTFAGWSGGTDCVDGSVTMNANVSCTATFNVLPQYTLTVGKSGTGSGTITTSPTGINCGTTCAANYSSNQLVNLFAAPVIGSIFTGWGGDADCADGSVTMNTAKICTANFTLGSSSPFTKGDDVNGDKKADLILHGTNNTFWISLSTGSAFTTPALVLQHGGDYEEGQAQYVDLNGDGKTDVIYQSVDNSFWVSLSAGWGVTTPTVWIKHGGWFEPGQAQYADLNGDGKADLIMQGLDNSFWVSLSTGTGFTTPTVWIKHGSWFEPGQAQYADLNGDGKADLIMQGLDNSFWVSLSTGTGFTTPTVWIKYDGWFEPGQAQYADVNGDGKSDLVYHGTDGSIRVNLSMGTSFSVTQLWLRF